MFLFAGEKKTPFAGAQNLFRKKPDPSMMG